MTIEEGIALCKAKSEEYARKAEDGIIQIGKEALAQEAAKYQQLVQWLTELKDLREVNRVLIDECDRLIKEKGGLLKKVAESPQIAIYKQLLKSATVIIKNVDCNDDYLCDECEYRAKCDGSFSFYWKRLNEASKLIGGDTE